MNNKMYNVKIKIRDNRKYGPKNNDKVISYCKIEHHNGLDKNTVLYLFKDYLDVILDINKNVVEPTSEYVSKLNLYNNDLDIFPKVLKYYKDRYLKYKECIDKLDDVSLKKFTIDLSKCYRFYVDDIVSNNVNKNVSETITVECY